MNKKYNFTKQELIDKVKKGDPIGKKMMEIEMEFLRSLKKQYRK